MTLRYVQFKIKFFGENIDDSEQTPNPPPKNALELLMSKPKVDKQPQLKPVENARFTDINTCYNASPNSATDISIMVNSRLNHHYKNMP